MCPIEVTLNVIGGKWKFLIVKNLLGGKKRFSELYRSIEGITQRMLTKQLRELERDGIINRIVYPEVPPKVEYELTPIGKELYRVFVSLQEWGELYLKEKGYEPLVPCDTEIKLR